MTLDDIRYLFTYTEWANALVLAAAAQLTDEQLRQDRQISHRSLLGTLLHMAAAEWIWLERWHGRSPTGPDVWTPWKEEHWASLADVRARWEAVAAARRDLLATLSDADVPRVIHFRRIDGSAHSLPLGQQMQHVVNHATLHRGQVVGMLRQLGLTPPATDLLFFYRG